MKYSSHTSHDRDYFKPGKGSDGAFVVCIPNTVNELVTDIILHITSQEHLMLTLLHITSKFSNSLAKRYV